MVISQRIRIDQIGIQLFKRHRSKKPLWQSWSSCKFSSSTKPDPTTSIDRSAVISKQPPLTHPLPGVPKTIYATVDSAKDEQHSTLVTTLPNGLRVASENRFGQFCTIGVAIDAGSRYEISYPSGISHFLEKLAFSSSSQYADKDNILSELGKYGGICDCQSSRDSVVYAASANSKGVDTVVEILADVVLRPKISEEEVFITRQRVEYELESLLMSPEQELLLMDMIHAAAFRDNTLGLPKICPAENVNVINRNVLFTFLQKHYTPKRMVVAGVGVDHDLLVESVNKHFVDKSPIWTQDTSLILPGKQPDVDESIAQYTGGIVQEECQIPQHAGPSGLPELAHVVIGFEGASHKDPEFIATCVLNMVMGGGGSFSAGGPGKGMYTRLYTNVLNRYHWMFSAVAYNCAYSDTGVFCIHASAPPNYVRDMVQVIIREMLNMTGELCPTELRRAKTQLQSMLLMNLESRAVVFEDIAKQVLATNRRKSPQEFIEAIEKISEDDIRSAAQKMLRSVPSIAARGDIRKMPTLQDIQSAFVHVEGKLPGGLKNRLSMPR